MMPDVTQQDDNAVVIAPKYANIHIYAHFKYIFYAMKLFFVRNDG